MPLSYDSISYQSKEIIDYKYDSATDFYDGHALVEKDL